MKKCPEQVSVMVEQLYKENFTKKKKTIHHFKVLGKIYDNNIFSTNYINFLKDVSKIHGYELFKLCIPPSHIATTADSFTECHLVRNQIVKISEGFYVSTHSST
jgi:hypothetical protein